MAHANLKPGHYMHFEPEQAYHASKFGMWLFLATEVLFFGGLFCAYTIFRWNNLEMFVTSSHELDWKLGGINTVVLLISSFFMAMAVDAAQHGDNKKVIRNLDITFFCACLFMVIKTIEYSAKFSHDIYPGTNIFFGIYFVMTGIHGLHVVIGMGVIYWLRTLAKKNLFSQTYYTPVEVVGLYWHLVDIIWIFLFPLLYLIDLSH